MWREETDPQTGNKYYYNTTTLQSSWERPASDVPSDPGLAVSHHSLASNSHDQDEATTPAVLASEAHGESDGGTPAVVADWVGLASTLMRAKRAWRALVDNNTGHTFYYDKTTGESQWEAPPDMAPDEHQDPEPAVHGPQGGPRQYADGQQQGPEPVHRLQGARQGADGDVISDRPQLGDGIASATTANNVRVEPAGAPAAFERRISSAEEDKPSALVTVSSDLDPFQVSLSPLDLDPAAHGKVIRDRRTEFQAEMTEDKGREKEGEEPNSHGVLRGGGENVITAETTRGGGGAGEEGIGRSYEYGASKDNARTEGAAFDVGASVKSEEPAPPADRASSSQTRQTQHGDGVKQESGDVLGRMERVESSSTMSTRGEGLDSLAQYVTGHSSASLDRGEAMGIAITDQGSEADSKEKAAGRSSSERYPDDTTAGGSQQPTSQSISQSDTEDSIRGASGNTEPRHEIVVHDQKSSTQSVLHDWNQEIGEGEVKQAPVMAETSPERKSMVHAADATGHSSNHRGREAPQTAANGLAQVPIDEFPAQEKTLTTLPDIPSDDVELIQKVKLGDVLPGSTSPSGHVVPSFDTAAVATVAFDSLQAGLMIRRQAVASVKIQAQARRWAAARLYSKLSERREVRRREELEAQQRAATAIQAIIRGFAGRQEIKVKARNITRSESQRTRDQPMTGVTDSVPAYPYKDEPADRGTDDERNNSDTTSLVASSSPEVQQQHHIDDTSSVTHTSRARSTSSANNNCGRREEESRTTEKRSEGAGHGVHKTKLESAWLGAENNSKGIQSTPGVQEISGNQRNQRSSTTSDGFGGVEVDSSLLRGLKATDAEDRQQEDRQRKGTHAESPLCPPGLDQEPDSLGGSRLDGGEVGRTSSPASFGETYVGADVVHEEPTSVGDDGDGSDKRSTTCETGSKTSTGGRGGGWSKRTAPTNSTSRSDSSDCSSSHQTSDYGGNQQQTSPPHKLTEKNKTTGSATVNGVGGVGGGTVPLKSAAELAGAGDGGGGDSDETNSCSTVTATSGKSTSTGGEGGGGVWSERTASNSSSMSDDNGDLESHRSYGSEGLQQSPPDEVADSSIFGPAAAVAAADHVGRVDQEEVFLGGTEDETRYYARGVNAVERMVGETVMVREGAHIDATASLETLEDLRSLVTEQAEATARIAMAATLTEASRREAGRMRYAHERPPQT